jgi:hypothetical protein
MPRLTERTADRLSTALWVSVAVVALGGAVLTVAAWGDLQAQDSFPTLVSTFGGVLYASLGALIVRRARNAVGWILQGAGLGLAVLSFTSAYAVVAIVSDPGALPNPQVVGALSLGVFAATSMALSFMLFVFPRAHCRRGGGVRS